MARISAMQHRMPRYKIKSCQFVNSSKAKLSDKSTYRSHKLTLLSDKLNITYDIHTIL